MYTTTIAEEAPWRQYSLKIFFSADIVGSTAFKQEPQAKAVNWFDMVMSFYHQMELNFIKKWREITEQVRNKSNIDLWFGEQPVVWKTLGDEILFVKDVTHPMQAYLAVRAWVLTLEEIKGTFRAKHKNDLDVKASSWLADFPLKNKEVVLGRVIPNGDDDYNYLNELALELFYSANKLNNKWSKTQGSLVRDFVGPSIDTGFRLGGLTSPRRLIISVELAYLLACEQSYAEENEKWHAIGPTNISRFVFRYEGRKPLKGVLGGRPYPVFWIDLDSENKMHRGEEDLLSLERPSSSKIKSFIDAVFDEFKDYLARPMFCSSLSNTSVDEGGFADCHSVICPKTIEDIELYASEIQEKEEKRRKELEDIGKGVSTDSSKEMGVSVNQESFRARIFKNINK